MDSAETLREIREIVVLQQQAIVQHPPGTGTVYRRGPGSFLEGQGSEERDASRSR